VARRDRDKRSRRASGPLEHPFLDRQQTTDAILTKLGLSINMKLDGLLHGDYRGLVPGHGSDPGETRRYAPGDDVRRIDWNVTARMQDPYIRQTIADRELETSVAVDLSPSLDFGTALCEKRDLALAATAAVGFLTARIGNRFGAELLRPSGIESVPARQGRLHMMAILEKVHTSERSASGRTPLAQGIARLGGAHRRPGLRVVISDFLDDSDWPLEMRRLAARHESLAIEIIDPRELELPAVGRMAVIDPVSGKRREVTTSEKLRRNYAQAATAQRAANAQAFRNAGTDHLVLRTDRDWLLDVVQFIAGRRKRQEANARVT